jgi:hypothetical protein
MNEIRLKLKQSNEKKAQDGFYGREKILTEAQEFIRDSSGGTVLIGGVRGIGKTRFIEELRNTTGWNRKTKYIFIDIAINDSIKPDELREVLLRNICHSLDEVERKISARRLNGLSWFKVYLRNWFSGRIWGSEPRVGRKVYYKELKRLSDYAKLNIVSKKGFGLGWSSSSTGINNELLGEVDTSNIRIERILRKYLERISELGCKVIFVFDELDKLDGEATDDVEQLSSVMVAKKFKNLLTTNNTFAIFATTEQSYRFLKRKISRDPYCAEHTLFSRTFLLSQLSFDDFTNIITSRLYRPETDNSQKITDYLAWRSAGHLFSLNEIIKEHQFADHIVFDDFEINYPSALHYYVRIAYEKHKSDKDSYYNHMLYLSLRYVTTSLFGRVGNIAFIRDSYLPLLVNSSDTEIPEEVFELRGSIRMHKVIGMFKDDNWRQGIELLSRNEHEKLNRALGDLLWLLDESNLLVFRQADQYVEIEFIGDGLGYDNAQRVRFVEAGNTKNETSIIIQEENVRKLAKELDYAEKEYVALLNDTILNSLLGIVAKPDEYIHRSLSYERENIGSAIEQLSQNLDANAVRRFVEKVTGELNGGSVNSYYGSNQLNRLLNTYSINTSYHVGNKRLWFCADIPEGVKMEAVPYLNDQNIVINVISRNSDITPQKRVENWYDVKLKEDYSNYRQKIQYIVKKLGDLSK